MIEKGYDTVETDSVIDRAIAAGLLDDVAFAKLWVRDRTDRHPLSRAAVTQELRDKGVGAELIDQTLTAEYPPEDEIRLARDLATARLNRLRSVPLERRKERVLGFLRRRGFSYSMALQAVLAAQKATQDE